MRTVKFRKLKAENKNSDYVEDYWRPKTRADCSTFPRPCPYVGCRHHLMLEVKPSSIKFVAESPDELQETCSLDVAERGPQTLEAVADLCLITRERARQIEEKALQSMQDLVHFDGKFTF